MIYVSATPGPYELEKAELVTEQVIRPTGLTDPEIIVRPATNQVDDLLGWIKGRVATDERVLVTTLTKSMAEDLTDYYADLDIQVRYLHSDIKTIERMEIIRDLRLGCSNAASKQHRKLWQMRLVSRPSTSPPKRKLPMWHPFLRRIAKSVN